MKIPKIIHQTFGPDPLTMEVRNHIAHLKQMNPGWEHRMYTDADQVDFISTEYPSDVLAAYLRINPEYGTARADFFRYLLIFKLGGVYLDIKSSTARALDSIIHSDDYMILALWDNGVGKRHYAWGQHPSLPEFNRGEFQQWHIIAEPHHLFLHGAITQTMQNIKQYNSKDCGVGATGVWNTTGPIAYSKAIAPLLTTCPHRMAGTNNDLGLIYNVFDKASSGSQPTLSKVHYSQLKTNVILPQ